jgi:type-F conjugative transfer system pilin assembly protein TrbC
MQTKYISQLGDPSHKPYDILIFVSSSMPEAELKNYSKQAHSFGATLVLRGFVQDKSSETRAFVSALNEGGGGWMIHPEAFKLFRVDKVPTIVLADATSKTLREDGCAQETAYTKVSGDLTLDAALDLFGRQAEPIFATLSKKILSENKAQYQPGKINLR